MCGVSNLKKGLSLFSLFVALTLGFCESVHAMGSSPASSRSEDSEGISFSGSLRWGVNYRDAVMAEANSHLGESYVYGSSGPHQFDCSGFLYYVLNKVLGHQNFTIGRTTAGEYADFLDGRGARINCANSSPADVVFFPGAEGGPYVNHIGMMANPKNGNFIAAQSTKTGVKIYSINGEYWVQRKPRCFTNVWIEQMH